MDLVGKSLSHKMGIYERLDTKELWCRLSYYSCDVDIFCILKCLLTRCNVATPQDFFPRESSTRLVGILMRKQLPQVHILTCILIGVFSNVSSTKKVDLVTHDVIHALDLLITVSFNPIAEEKRRIQAIQQKHNSAIVRQREAFRKCELAEQIMSLLVYFSLGPAVCVNAMVFEGVIPHMVPLMNWRYTPVFPVSARAMLRVEGLVLNRQLVARQQTIDMDSTHKGYTTYFQCFHCEPPAVLDTTPGRIIHLYDTNLSNVDVDIAMELQKGGYVMRTRRMYAAPDDSSWVDAEVQTVIGPCRYWAWLGGEKTRKIITRIQQTLPQLFAKEQVLVAPPVVGDIVAVARDPRGPYRGCVLKISQDKIWVFAVDHGFIQETTIDRLYTMDSTTERIPPQAVYCELKGVLIPPRNVQLLSNMLIMVCNLASKVHLSVEIEIFNTHQVAVVNWVNCVHAMKSSILSWTCDPPRSIQVIASCDILDDIPPPIYHAQPELKHGISNQVLDNVDVISLLLTWALCDNHLLQVKALKALCNMTRHPDLQARLGEAGAVEAMIGLIQEYSHLMKDPNIEDVLEVSLLFLTNLLFQCQENKDRLAQANGVELLLLETLSGDTIPKRVREASVKVLQVYVGSSNLNNYCRAYGLNTRQGGDLRTHEHANMTKGSRQESQDTNHGCVKRLADEDVNTQKTHGNHGDDMMKSTVEISPVTNSINVCHGSSESHQIDKSSSSGLRCADTGGTTAGSCGDPRLTTSTSIDSEVKSHDLSCEDILPTGNHNRPVNGHNHGNMEHIANGSNGNLSSVRDTSRACNSLNDVHNNLLNNSHHDKHYAGLGDGVHGLGSDNSRYDNIVGSISENVGTDHLSSDCGSLSPPRRSRRQILKDRLQQEMNGSSANQGPAKYISTNQNSVHHISTNQSSSDHISTNQHQSPDNSFSANHNQPGQFLTNLSLPTQTLSNQSSPAQSLANNTSTTSHNVSGNQFVNNSSPTNASAVLSTHQLNKPTEENPVQRPVKNNKRFLGGSGNAVSPRKPHSSSGSSSTEGTCIISSDRSTEQAVTKSREICMVDTAALYHQAHQNHYIRGEHVDFTADISHDLYSRRLIDNIKDEYFMKIATSFLNTGKGGGIYIGIQSNGKVVGIHINHNKRDGLRIWVDKFMTKIIPTINPELYEVVYTPVYGSRRDIEPLTDIYVIEIRVFPVSASGTIYYLSNGVVYFREDSQTFVASSQNIKEKAVEDEEVKYLTEIEFLQKEIAAAKHALELSK